MNAESAPAARTTQEASSSPIAPGRSLLKAGEIDKAVVALRDPECAAVESLRGTAMRLMAGVDHRRMTTVAVVSPQRGDGRSFVTANLAALFAQAGQRTLLIDADFRAPRQHELFQCAAGSGLIELLRRQTDEQIWRSVDSLPGLRILTAGNVQTAGDAVNLASGRFGELLEELRASVDQIVIDTPAGETHPDAEAIAAHAGAALLIVRRNVTRVAVAGRLADNIRTAGARILGTIVNHR